MLKKSAVSAALVLSLMQIAQAQVPDVTLLVTAQITSNTCTLSLSDGTSSATKGTLSLDFGKIAMPTDAPPVGTGLGMAKTVTLSTRNATGLDACASSGVTGDKANFNVLLDLNASQVTTVAGKTYRMNDLAGSGTNAVLALAAGPAITTNSQLNLRPRSGDSGTFAAASPADIATGKIQLTLQLATSTPAVPSLGAFSAKIPLYLVYQ
jgi:hypothetical protein